MANASQAPELSPRELSGSPRGYLRVFLLLVQSLAASQLLAGRRRRGAGALSAPFFRWGGSASRPTRPPPPSGPLHGDPAALHEATA